MTTKLPTKEALIGFAKDLETLKQKTLAKIGQKDANYIRRILRIQRGCEVAGRSFLMVGYVPLLWIAGTVFLSISKILDNMEIGHNVMHGQYDWMNDEVIHSSSFEWDNTCDSKAWQRTHNHEHHTYTNIIGKDKDYGYGLLRLDSDTPWKFGDLFNLVKFALLSIFFQYGVGLQEIDTEGIKLGKTSWKEKKPLLFAFLHKVKRHIFRDYAFYPALGAFTGAVIPVLTGNLIANLIRNLWASAVIFCGHFPDGVHTFEIEDCENESKGQWYYRQILGSCNFKGNKLLQIMSGHLSFQIEHHLFPDIPSYRYEEIAKEVKSICEKYNIPYNNRSFTRQYFSTIKRMFNFSFPKPVFAVS